MIKSLNYSCIGEFPGNIEAMAIMAKKYGFEGIEATAALVLEYGVEETKNILKQTGLKLTAFSMPFRPVESTKEEYDKKLAEFEVQAQAMEAVGCPVCFTFVRSSSDELEYEENYKLHIERWAPVAAILKKHNIKLALEFLGPLTSQKKKKYPFIRTAEELLPLCKEMGDNVGLLFDFWHWYSGSNDKNVFDHIEGAKYIYQVHLNDALNNSNKDELQDKPRKLVGTSGVIDTAYLVNKLNELGYEGACISESFSDEVKNQPTLDDKVRIIKEAIDAALDK